MDKGGSLGRIAGQPIDDFKAFEGIASVKDAMFVGNRRCIGRLLIHKEDTPAIGAVDGRAAYNDGEVESTFIQLSYAQRHLLGSTHQQSGETNGIGIHLNSLTQDGV